MKSHDVSTVNILAKSEGGIRKIVGILENRKKEGEIGLFYCSNGKGTNRELTDGDYKLIIEKWLSAENTKSKKKKISFYLKKLLYMEEK